jgi:pyridoxine 4-dehydrogenase
VLAACEQDGLPFMAWHPLANGELPNPSERPSSEIIDRVASQHGATRAQVALAWLLQHSPVTLPIPGTTTLEHLQENVAAASLRLTREELESLYNHARPDSERGSRSPAQSHASDH